ncbi:hypothetical protein MAR_030169 [Mya arenaria]|uniref:Uncharacterized protein n=1 Tax=Mya arenaria TaxID=6604 RepID=A0ABY7DJG3_MYAAR|nr:hypothetical protein MAR_030169 [Mya arenaria]
MFISKAQTTTTTTATVKSSPATISGDKCESMHVLMIYSSVSVTVILSVAMGIPRRYADSGIQAVTADLNNLSATSSSGNGVVICSPVDETNAVQYFVTAEPSMTMLRQENKNVCPTEEATTFLEEDEGLLQQYRSLMARHDSSLEEVTSTISL